MAHVPGGPRGCRPARPVRGLRAGMPFCVTISVVMQEGPVMRSPGPVNGEIPGYGEDPVDHRPPDLPHSRFLPH